MLLCPANEGEQFSAPWQSLWCMELCLVRPTDDASWCTSGLCISHGLWTFETHIASHVVHLAVADCIH